MQEKRFSKPKFLFEDVRKHPYEKISKVFSLYHREDLIRGLSNWLKVALSNNNSAYHTGTQRRGLIDFYGEVMSLIEAFHLINESRKPFQNDGSKQEANKHFNLPEIMVHQISDPLEIIGRFCKRYSKSYIKYEMWYWLDAVIGALADTFGNLLLFYQCILCLLESSYVITKGNATK